MLAIHRPRRVRRLLLTSVTVLGFEVRPEWRLRAIAISHFAVGRHAALRSLAIRSEPVKSVDLADRHIDLTVDAKRVHQLDLALGSWAILAVHSVALEHLRQSIGVHVVRRTQWVLRPRARILALEE